jgi:uncharacterized protein YndB with AHSA1/START domain
MTTTTHSATVTLPSDTEIVITRGFDAPARLVWRAYTTPELVKRWWAGQRGTVTSAEIDLRVGGTWRYVMAADHGEVAFHGEFRAVEAPGRLVTTEVFEGAPDGMGVITSTFEETDGRTLLTQVCDYGSREVRDAVIASGMEGGMQESLDALEIVAVDLNAG